MLCQKLFSAVKDNPETTATIVFALFATASLIGLLVGFFDAKTVSAFANSVTQAQNGTADQGLAALSNTSSFRL